jgi:hypothetical protein
VRPPASRLEASVNAGGSPFPIEFFVQAHQDDWQLFLGDRAAGAVPTAGKVVFIYTTAGDAGSTTDGYWQAREVAAQASINAMTAAGTWTCANQTANGHVIHRCVKGTVVSYHLRLPDGNGDGQGYSPAYASLSRLRSGAIGSLRAINSSTTYTSWSDLVATIRAIVTLEAGSEPDANIAVHAPEYDLEVNGGDHGDHLSTGELVKAGLTTRPWNVFWYLGYPSMFEPVNLTSTQQALKWKLIVAYDNVLKGDYGTIIGTSHAEEWSERTIYRTQWTTGSPPPPPPPPTTVPVAPSALLASPTASGIALTWTDNASDEQGFRIERALDADGLAGAFAEIATVGTNVTTYSSTDVVGNTRYWFRVRAYNVVGPSDYTNEATAILVAPASPAGLAAAPVSATRIDLSWTDVATDEQGFRIERAPDAGGVPGTFTEVASVAANITSFSNTGLQLGTRYWYRVLAYNAFGSSAYSNEASATTLSGPGAPTALTATTVSSSRIDLAWIDTATDEQGFRVERAPDLGGAPGVFAQIASVGVNVRAYSSSGLAKGTRYWYRVRAYNAIGSSAYSNEANATTLGPPAMPSDLQGVSPSSGIIDLSWTDTSADETSFRVERAPDVGGAPGTFGSGVKLGANVTTYRVTGLTAATTYWFRVRSQNSLGNSAYTAPVRISTIAVVPPSALTATAYLVGTTRNVDLRWTPGSEPTVDIYRNGSRIASGRLNDGGPYNNRPAASLGASVAYQVCAAGKTGSANCSAVVNATF